MLEPVLGCVARSISPVCTECGAGRLGNCTNIAFGELEPGLQSGYCADTGGGWSTLMVAHPSQLHPVPAELSDEAAMMIEPAACALHAALAGQVSTDDRVVMIGSGTVGLSTLAGLLRYTNPAHVTVVAKPPHQRAVAAGLLGARLETGRGALVEPGETKRSVRRTTGSLALGAGDISRLTGGAEVVFDCVGSADSLSDALAIVAPRGRIVIVGMPGVTTVDLTGLWHKEVTLLGAYAYGTEVLPAGCADAGAHRRTFELAMELVAAADLGRFVSATYPLARVDDAITHAANAGARGALKVAFDLRNERERRR